MNYFVIILQSEFLANLTNSWADSVRTVVLLYKVKIKLVSLFSEMVIATDLIFVKTSVTNLRFWKHFGGFGRGSGSQIKGRLCVCSLGGPRLNPG